MSTVKVREDRVRRQLIKDGFRLRKMPARSWLRRYYPVGYVIYSSRGNPVLGCCGRAYTATLEEVETFAFEAM
jgi:hypothetical protein